MINIENLEGLKLVFAVAYNAGFKENNLLVAVAIAYAESSLNPDAEGDLSLQNDKWGPSVGLWQIRSLKNSQKYDGSDKFRDYDKLFDPQYNAIAAYEISGHGSNFGAWSTFVNNAYLQYINDVIYEYPKFKSEFLNNFID